MNVRSKQLVIGFGGTALAVGFWGLGFLMGGGGDGLRFGSDKFSLAPRNAGSVVNGSTGPSSVFWDSSPHIPMKSDDIGATLRRIVRESSAMRRSELLVAVVVRLNADEIKAALSEVRRLPGSDQDEVTRALFARWAELNPLDAAQYALEHDNSRLGLEGVLSTWIVRDADGALRWVKSLPAGEKRDESISRLIGALSRRDPRAAFQLIQENPNLYSSNLYEIQNVMARWVDDDPQGAASAALSIDNQAIRGRAIVNAATGWANRDPHAAFQWANGLSNSRERQIALQGVFSKWAVVDASVALEQANALTTPEERSMAAGAVAVGVASYDLKRAVELVKTIPDGVGRDLAAGDIARQLSKSDPRSAVALAGMISEPSSRQSVMVAALNGMAAQDPREALSFIDSLPDRDNYGRVTSSAIQRWISTDPTSALLAVGQGELSSASRRPAAVQAGFGWAQQNPAKAFSTLEDLPRGSATSAVLEGVLKGVAFSDPRRAAELSATKFQGQVPPESFRVIGAQWAIADPSAAREWVYRLPDSAKWDAVTGVAAGLANRNPTEAAKWVENLPSGNMRDHGIVGFAAETSNKDPEAALTWAATISDPQKRELITRELLQAWKARDLEAASSWLVKNKSVAPSNSQ